MRCPFFLALSILVLSNGFALAQTWTDLGSGTQLNLVAPANCANSAPPAYCAGVSFGYLTNFFGVTTAWSSAVARTKAGSEQLLIFGGGHDSTLDNSVYALNLNVSPATVSALTTPSIPNASGSPASSTNVTCTSPNADGTPLSFHTYGQLVYLPVADKMFFWEDGAGNYCGTPASRYAWLFDPVAKKWQNMMPTGVAGFNVYAAGDGQDAFCALDTTNAITTDETVICEWGLNDMLLRYDATNNTWAQLTKFGTGTYPNAATAAIDPVRKIMLMMGATSSVSGVQQVIKVDISTSSYNFTDITSSLTGCAPLNTPYPGLVYDPVSGNFMAYPGTGNAVYEFNPDTGVCQPFTASGGPTAVNGTATLGRWNYFPSLGEYVNVATVGTDAFAWQPTGSGSGTSPVSGSGTPPVTGSGTPPVSGSGAPIGSALGAATGLGASTVSCVDRDGDGYGTGPGCLGPDADDLDSSVQTATQGITKWGTLANFLLHLGYAPTRTWYIATTGNDSTCVSGGAPVGIGSPCLTFRPISTNLLAGDMVLYRAGTYATPAGFAPTVNGTAANPIIGMAYPGESVLINTSDTSNPGATIIDESYVIVDGLKFTNGLNSGCVEGGTSNYGLSSNTFHDVTIRRVEAYGCIWGIIMAGLDNTVIEDSVLHDNMANGGQHGIYIGAKGNALASNNTIHRVISYNNGYTGIQVNGNVAGLVEDQNISYGNLIADYSWENGVHNSFFRSNLAMAWGGSGGLVISDYNGNEGLTICGSDGVSLCVCTPTPNLGATCAHDQTGNLIENFTAYGTSSAQDGTNVAGVPPISVALQNRSASCTTATCLGANLGNNTFRNVIAVTYGVGNQYPPIIFNDSDKTYLATSTFSNIMVKQTDSTNGSAAIGFGLNTSSYGFNAYTCAASAAITTISNCTNADPQFVAASPTYFNSPSSFNFNLAVTSPALHAGTTTGVPSYDLVGDSFASPPSLGAIEQMQASGTPPAANPCDLNGDGVVNAADVQIAVSQALGITTCGSAALEQAGQCNVVDVQRVVNAALGGACLTGQ